MSDSVEPEDNTEPDDAASANQGDDFVPAAEPAEAGPTDQKLTGLDLELTYLEEQRKVQVAIIPSANEPDINEKYVLETLAAAGYGDLLIDDKKMKSLLKSAKEKRRAQVALAERCDSEVTVSISEDAMTVFLTMTKSYGGRAYSAKDLEYELQKSGVTEGILSDVIEEVANEGVCEDKVVAEGLTPINGEPSQFECLVSECLFKGPQVDESGKIDFFDLQEFVIIEPDVELMRKTPPTAGKNGYDVYGQVVPAVPGEDIPFKDTEGVIVSPNDPDLLISTIKGHPVVFETGVEVDPSLTLKSVDLSTGNVTFDGSVHIKGDIGDNMRVEATGNVMVDGVIQKATVIAGGDILVKNGVIGGALQEDEEAIGVMHYGASLTAEGEIQARFIDNASLESGNKIVIREYIRHSKACAVNEVQLGKQGGRGQIIGGRTTAGKSVYVKLLGTQADVHTFVEVGVAPALRAQFDELTDKADKLNEDMHGLVISFNHLRGKMSEEGESEGGKDKDTTIELAQNIKGMLKDFEKCSEQLRIIEEKMAGVDDANVQIQSMVFRNVVLKIKDVQLKFKEEAKGGKYVIKGKRIEAS